MEEMLVLPSALYLFHYFLLLIVILRAAKTKTNEYLLPITIYNNSP